VTTLVVFVNAERLTIKAPPTGVQILTRRGLQRWLRRRPEHLAAGEAVFDQARRSSTWVE
jgi:hypothetical protein